MTVRVAPNLVPEIEQRLKAAVASAGFEGRLVVAADAALGPADCGIDWGDGGAERDMDGLWREIDAAIARSEEHTSELQSLMRISYAVFCLKKKKNTTKQTKKNIN